MQTCRPRGAAVLFLQPPSAAVLVSERGGRGAVRLPRGRGSVHYECEICLRLGQRTEVTAVTLGLDMTLRDVQAQLKKAGHAWELGKACPAQAPRP